MKTLVTQKSPPVPSDQQSPMSGEVEEAQTFSDHNKPDHKTSSENENVNSGKKSVWTKFDIFLDRTHLSLKGHETAFLTALCLFCTVLCVFVTDRHLTLELRVARAEAEIQKLSQLAGQDKIERARLEQVKSQERKQEDAMLQRKEQLESMR